ncbi:RecBCD enzyme subunit RecB [Burkholderiales bacterium 8X]|nr:RecBCD enzyme subunit RecB [Burkholderiales bacterium 8X]
MKSDDPTTMPAVLDALRFPLRGSRLIEASAGTGKTFTIAALYLRLVLGHGGADAFVRPLNPPEILVVTFTEAATQELRDRIRTRLAEASDAFRVDPETVPRLEPGVDLLHDLRADYPPAEWPACAQTLRLAAEWMDEAAVSTIHGWCNRMLSEHAFDSGSLFTQSLETDQRALQAEVVRDYWRSFFIPLSAADARQVRAWWKAPAALQRQLEPLVALSDSLAEGLAPEAALQAAREGAAHALAALKKPWAGEQGWAVDLLQWIDEAVAAKRCKMPKRKDWLQALRDWAEGDAPLPKLSATAWLRLSPAGLADGWTGDAPPRHPALDACASLQAAVDALDDGKEDLLRHAAHWCAERLMREQLRRAQMGFDELLTRFDAALRGPNGSRLADLIRRQFPVALIDEFQDTDPIQYRIFDAVYGVARNPQDQALLLIGDPKQAIYAFRGGDIYTYLEARRDTQDRHATLGTNYRSTNAMVAAVNRMFGQAEDRREGRGAFLFRESGSDPLPFVPIGAKGRGEHWSTDGRHEAAALTCWTLPADQPVRNGDAQRRLAAACATEIVRLLQEGSAGRAGFVDTAGLFRPVQPGDMAVLVNSGREAQAVRRELQQRRVRSVYLSDKGSVFQSAVAADLRRWLVACAEPDDDRRLRSALGTGLLALSFGELDALNDDELRWEARVLQFRAYQQVWRRQGVLPMLRHLIHDFGIAPRLVASGDERGLTDLLHLAELLQQASAELNGEHALVRWLGEQCEDQGGDNDARKLRLESDAELVKVVTVHKSKGLEYPLVFMPFATAYRPASGKDLPIKWHDESGRLVVQLHADDEVLARVDRERLGEDLRKLYVGLTRARHATWIGVAPIEGVERSALGYLLGGGRPLAPRDLQHALDELAAGCDAISVEAAPEPGSALFDPQVPPMVLAPEPPLASGPRERWWIASYSALRHGGTPELAGLWNQASGAAVPASAAEDIYADSRDSADGADGDDPSGRELLRAPWRGPATDRGAAGERFAADAVVDASVDHPADLHGFPRGADAGTFLHGLLEWAGRKGFARLAADPAAKADMADLIARRCNLKGWGHWIEPLQRWLAGWVERPLRIDPPPAGEVFGAEPVLNSRIAPAALGSMQIEMEFWFSAQSVDAVALDALVRRHTLGGAPRPHLLPQQLNGMLKGYIDLVFEHQGRYYVADYKSNWLGPRDADYTPAALRAQVLQHRYELQYVLYVFALHRLLRLRLADYDYERHLGGAVYLFLRGHAAPGQGLHLERPSRELIDSLDRLFRGENAR